MSRFLPIQGTWGWGRGSKARWWQSGTPFVEFFAASGLALIDPDDPFVWNTNVDGASPTWLPFSDKHRDWICGGINLRQRLKPSPYGPDAASYIPYEDRNLVAHSHGLQVALYAAAGITASGACTKPLRIRRLVSVMGPVRDDMTEIAEIARPQIGEWLHLCSDHSDLVQVLGGVLDGRFGIVREHPLADRNEKIAGVGHTGLLEDPDYFHYWRELGALDWLNGLRPLKG